MTAATRPPADWRRRALPRPQDRDIPHFVYRCYDRDGRLLYVGCTNNPVYRLQSHAANSWWGSKIHSTRLIVFPNRDKALSVERLAIWSEMPRCNIKGRWWIGDDRADWSAQDYLDLDHAVRRSVDSTHGIYGVNTRRLLANIADELRERHGVAIAAGRRSA